MDEVLFEAVRPVILNGIEYATRSDLADRLIFLNLPPIMDTARFTEREFWATFEDDRAGVLTRELIGIERLMWGSDYPHTEGTFGFSAEMMKSQLGWVKSDIQLQ